MLSEKQRRDLRRMQLFCTPTHGDLGRPRKWSVTIAADDLETPIFCSRRAPKQRSANFAVSRPHLAAETATRP
jgi:hypothetical protein